MKVALLGASDREDRFAYKAYKKLAEAGHVVFLVHPQKELIDGQRVYKDLQALPESPHTVTLYVSAAISTPLLASILQSGAKRVILNPGTENPVLEEELSKAGVLAVRDCTLLMIEGNRF